MVFIVRVAGSIRCPSTYLWQVIGKMFETREIGLWATLLAILSARNYTLHRPSYVAARALVSMMRAMPELISALFLVLAYGFGPTPGVLALALHSAGFLGKFYAEDIENADGKPQDALRAIGAGPAEGAALRGAASGAAAVRRLHAVCARLQCADADRGRPGRRGRHRAGTQGPLRHVPVRSGRYDPADDFYHRVRSGSSCCMPASGIDLMVLSQ
ncbi:PhnE/PtxC family ABC transporter permease [Paraburkholderia sp. RL17-347-BIC-D]|uniref:PhnE/PtxC family ABC transporter permease n=1 Tax=Paraburkholderia sp. RL17-347-BIC-D TaxID=3031632 RepID=UPI0038BACE79